MYMTNTPTVAHCPHCKMEVDPKASRCPHCHGKIYQWTGGRKAVLVLLALALIMFVAAAHSASKGTPTPRQAQTTPAPASVGVGEEGFLQTDGADKTFVLRSEELLDAFVQASVSNDTYGMSEILLAGGGFLVPNGTKALVIDRGTGRRKVRVLEGDFTGESGWIPMEFIQK